MVEMIDWAVGDAPLAGAAFSGAGLAAAIGNFDGVHRGHQTVVAAAAAAARRDGLLPSVITFDPHPREFFRQDEAPFYLADRREKDRLLVGLLGQMGPARVIHIWFDDALRSTGANQFVSEILAGLGVSQLYAGTDFAFGKGRGGDLQTINHVGKPFGISATAVPLLVDANTAVISSSRIRAALQQARLVLPLRCLAMIGQFPVPSSGVTPAGAPSAFQPPISRLDRCSIPLLGSMRLKLILMMAQVLFARLAMVLPI